MKVLLLQEMSGVHTELKKGLNKLGIETHIAAHNYSFRNYGSDIDLGSTSGSVLSHIERMRNQTLLAMRFNQYDVVQTISPQPFYTPLNNIFNAALSISNCKKVYIAAGSDAIYRKHVRELNYYPPHDWFDKTKAYSKLKKRLKGFDVIVPVCWEYQYAMEQAGLSPCSVIPFPVDLEKYQPKIRKSNKKIKFFHPINRTDLTYDFKGSLIIQEAFKILEKNYSDVADFICKGGMTYQEYDLFTNNVDVIVDQLYSHSYGMSAALGLAKGKVVISGLEKIAKIGNFKNCPIINSEPNVIDIVNKIEELILNNVLLKSIQLESRAFAEKYHCAVKVAEIYAKSIYA